MAGGAVVLLARMTNILSDDKRQEVLALGRLGWALRRIERATRVRRETAGAYLKAAGRAVQAPGRRGCPIPDTPPRVPARWPLAPRGDGGSRRPRRAHAPRGATRTRSWLVVLVAMLSRPTKRVSPRGRAPADGLCLAGPCSPRRRTRPRRVPSPAPGRATSPRHSTPDTIRAGVRGQRGIFIETLGVNRSISLHSGRILPTCHRPRGGHDEARVGDGNADDGGRRWWRAGGGSRPRSATRSCGSSRRDVRRATAPASTRPSP